jgi:hypothetical protein
MDSRNSARRLDAQEPTARDLQAIEDEWPVIVAELAVVDAEIAAARAGAEMTELDRRRSRRVTARLTRQIVAGAAIDGMFGGAA